MDSVHDTLRTGRKIRTLNVVDGFTRECLAIEVDTSLSGQRVAHILDAIAQEPGLSGHPGHGQRHRANNFGDARLARDRHVRLHYIAPWKPTANAFVESLNVNCRDECLNENTFDSLSEAREEIGQWRVDYNGIRPHRARGQETPEGFARSVEDIAYLPRRVA